MTKLKKSDDSGRKPDDYLTKEELLEEQKEVFDYYLENLRDYPSEVEVKQAYQQIREMIQASTNLKNKSLGRLAEDLGVSFSATKIISDHAQPEVTEEWIQKKAEDTASDYPDVAFPNLITIFKKLLKEAGVHVS